MTGVNALSIWMKATDRYMYTVLPQTRVSAMKKPTGSMRSVNVRMSTVFSAGTMCSTRQQQYAAMALKPCPRPERDMGYLKPAHPAIVCTCYRVDDERFGLYDTCHAAGSVLAIVSLVRMARAALQAM